MCLDGTLKSCYNTNKEGNDRRSLPVSVKITAHSLRQGRLFLFIYKVYNKRNDTEYHNGKSRKEYTDLNQVVQSYVHSFTSFQSTFALSGDEFDRLTSKVSLVFILT